MTKFYAEVVLKVKAFSRQSVNQLKTENAIWQWDLCFAHGP